MILKDSNYLSSCPANFECWTFVDGNVVMFHTTANVAAAALPLQFDIPNVDTPEYAGHDDIYLTSDIWIEKLHDHTVT